MSVETVPAVVAEFTQPRLTQDWEASHRPDEFAMVQRLAEMATQAEVVPPQRRLTRTSETASQVPQQPVDELPLLVQNGPNFLDTDNNVVPWQEGFALQKAGMAVLQLAETRGA